MKRILLNRVSATLVLGLLVYAITFFGSAAYYGGGTIFGASLMYYFMSSLGMGELAAFLSMSVLSAALFAAVTEFLIYVGETFSKKEIFNDSARPPMVRYTRAFIGGFLSNASLILLVGYAFKDFTIL